MCDTAWYHGITPSARTAYGVADTECNAMTQRSDGYSGYAEGSYSEGNCKTALIVQGCTSSLPLAVVGRIKEERQYGSIELFPTPAPVLTTNYQRPSPMHERHKSNISVRWEESAGVHACMAMAEYRLRYCDG